jgi:ribosomal protein L29
VATVAHLDFEKAISEVESQIARLQTLARERGLDVSPSWARWSAS